MTVSFLCHFAIIATDWFFGILGAQAAASKGPIFTGEYLEYNSGWMVAMITDDASSEVKLTDLSEGNRYQFRIKAVNAAGASEPSEETEEITCKIRKQKPMIQVWSLTHFVMKCMSNEYAKRLRILLIRTH